MQCELPENSLLPITTPILFLVFNRPDVTREVFEAIKAVKPETLYVAADGPRIDCPGEVETCKIVRQIATSVDWECKIKTLFRDNNLGCRKAVSGAIDWFFSEEQEGIIIEDDCVPDSSFFYFSQTLLEKYRNDHRVMMISGTNYFPESHQSNDSYLFTHYCAIWGWATWKRSWASYDVDLKAWRREIGPDGIRQLLPEKVFANQLIANFDLVSKGCIDTWDLQWFFNCLTHGGLSIVPSENLIENIGVVGTHSSHVSDNHFMRRNQIAFNLNHPDQVAPDSIYDRMMFKKAFGGNRLTSRIKDFCIRKLPFLSRFIVII